LIGFQDILLLLHQNRKYDVHILDNLPCLDMAAKANEKSGCVPRNSMGNLISAPVDTNAIAEFYIRVRSL
jgi:hypothetical protein